MKCKLLVMIALVMALICNLAACGDDKDKDEKTKTKSLSLEAFCEEIEEHAQATIEQRSMSRVTVYEGEDAPEFPDCAIYFEGEQGFLQYNAGGNVFVGKVGNRYVKIYEEDKTYVVIDEDQCANLLAVYRSQMMAHISDIPGEIDLEEEENFECTKITRGNKITYDVKYNVLYEYGSYYQRTVIEVENGVIVQRKYPDKTVSYSKNVIVELPDLSDYTER